MSIEKGISIKKNYPNGGVDFADEQKTEFEHVFSGQTEHIPDIARGTIRMFRVVGELSVDDGLKRNILIVKSR